MKECGPTSSRRTLLQAGGAAVALGSLGSLAACGNNGSSGSEPTTFWMLYFCEQKSADALQQALGLELAKNDPNVTLQVTGISGTDWNEFFAKVLTQIAAGTPPDIVGVATEGVQLMASKEPGDRAGWRHSSLLYRAHWRHQ